MTIVTVCSIPSCANSFDSFVYYHCLGILVWLNYTRPVSDIVFDGACDRINDKMDSLVEAQADRAIEKSREAEIESWEHAHGSQDSHYHHDGDNDHHHGSKSGGSESSHPTSPRLGFAGALSRHLTGALPLTSRSSAAVPATPKAHATSPAMEDNSAQRDLLLAVVGAVKTAVDAVGKQLAGVHVRRCVFGLCVGACVSP